jgi:hypothetical protein
MTINEAARMYADGTMGFLEFSLIASREGFSVRTKADAEDLLADMRDFGDL